MDKWRSGNGNDGTKGHWGKGEEDMGMKWRNKWKDFREEEEDVEKGDCPKSELDWPKRSDVEGGAEDEEEGKGENCFCLPTLAEVKNR
jgi:hypothetical protein